MSESAPLQHGTSAETVAASLRDTIRGGYYGHGQQLPSTRALAKHWSTSVATVTRAMQMLVAEGIVTARDRSSRVVNYPGVAVDTDSGARRIEDMATAELAELVARASAELASRLRDC